jgi:raffinose/stachyose/melibiose transport system permease protein
MHSQSRRWRLRSTLVGWAFILPAGVLYALFVLLPLAETFGLSLYKWNGLTPTRTFVGLANFRTLFQDKYFGMALQHTSVWVVAAVTIPVGLALLLAVLVEDGGIKAKQFFRSIFFLPHLMSVAVAGIVWAAIYDPSFGLFNGLLRGLGLGALAKSWIGNGQTALVAIIVAWAWQYFPYLFVIYIAGLQGVDRELYDAAAVDGTNAWQRFRYVTLPSLNRVHTMVLSLAIIAGLRPFAMVWTMTQGGPFFATEVIPTLLYKEGFAGDRLGYSAALGVVLAVLVFTVTNIFMRLRGGLEEA